MSGECNYCGGPHAEDGCQADRSFAYSNGYASGQADGFNMQSPTIESLKVRLAAREHDTVNMTGVIAELSAELSRLRVIEREHGEMRATLRAIVEHQDLVGGTMGAMSVTRKMAAVAISRLTPPAKAEGEGE